MNDMPDHAPIIALPPVIFAAFLGAGFVLGWLWPVPLPEAGWGWWIGGALIATALVLSSLAIRTLSRAQTAIHPHHPTTAIVTDGPFRYTRNPLYLSLVLIFLGTSLGFASVSMLILVIPFVAVLVKGVIIREERYLEAKFGDAYRTYRARVRRWL